MSRYLLFVAHASHRPALLFVACAWVSSSSASAFPRRDKAASPRRPRAHIFVAPASIFRYRFFSSSPPLYPFPNNDFPFCPLHWAVSPSISPSSFWTLCTPSFPQEPLSPSFQRTEVEGQGGEGEGQRGRDTGGEAQGATSPPSSMLPPSLFPAFPLPLPCFHPPSNYAFLLPPPCFPHPSSLLAPSLLPACPLPPPRMPPPSALLEKLPSALLGNLPSALLENLPSTLLAPTLREEHDLELLQRDYSNVRGVSLLHFLVYHLFPPSLPIGLMGLASYATSAIIKRPLQVIRE
ncbi:unnamed protein product [Closterium sp. NIES-65]|nr:unnamed protein product [Closterium sp. NIES-65]